MASLLIIIAVLEYRWAKQLSAATEVRIGSNLQSLMTGWERDFYDELSAICILLQVGPDSGAHDAWNDYLQRYAEWNRGWIGNESKERVNPNPDLVREIYDWQTSAPRRPELLRLNPKAKSLDPVSVPPELETLLARLQTNSSNLRLSLNAWEFSNSSEKVRPAGNNLTPSFRFRSNALAGWQFDEKIPALVHPIVHHANPFNSQTPVNREAVDWLMVVLDLSVIQKRILPELASRHFGGRDGLEYKLSVVATEDAPRVLFASDPTLSISDVDSFDSIMNISGAPLDNIQGEFWQAVKHSRNLQSQEWRNFSAPVWFPVIQYASHDEPWVLILEHRTGPVTAIARSAWHRDLIIGSVVLLLLTFGMGLIMVASRRAQTLARLRLDFVASVSHELLTPLSAIYCTGQNAKDGLVQTKTDLIAHGSIVSSQARRLIDLVKQNLLFAATETGTNNLILRPLRVSEIIECVGKNVAMLIEESGFTVEYEVQTGLPNVKGDLSGVTQCLQNFIVNAIKYSGIKNWIGVSASLHQAENQYNEVRISVQDHGPGISSPELKHIFKPFYRSQKVVDSQIQGTGLGLTVADRIAKAMGGRVSVTSEVGVGSTFTLHLPCTNRSAPAERDLGVQK